jgi:hypothetical protein
MAKGEDMYPVAVRNEDGKIVVVASGDIARMKFDGREFRFFEIGDSAAHPDYRSQGINRHIKHFLLSEAVKMHFDSIHTETRSAWKAPNFANSKNGMTTAGHSGPTVKSAVQKIFRNFGSKSQSGFTSDGSLNMVDDAVTHYGDTTKTTLKRNYHADASR